MALNRPSPEFQRAPEQFDTRQRLDTLSQQIRQQNPEQDMVAVANTIRVKRSPNGGLIFPPNRVVDGRMRNYFGKDALQRIQGAAARMGQLLEGTEQSPGGLQAQFDAVNNSNDPFSPAQAAAIEKMMTALTQEGPDTVGGRNKSAVYLNMSKHGKDQDGNPIAQYTVNLGNPGKSTEKYASENPRDGIRRNQAFLQELMQHASPQKALFLRGLIQAMEEYAVRVDSRKVYMHDYQRGKMMTPSRKEGRRLGRLATVIAGSGAAVLTGAMSLLSGHLSLTAPLYAGVALYAANPHLLDGKARRGVVQANRLLSSNVVREYRPQGQEWANIVERIQQGNIETKKFLQKQDDVTGTAVLDSLAPETDVSPAVRAQLRTMLEKGEFRAFAQKVLAVRDPDARSLVHDYIEQGASRFAA